jgi:hypothetical protein
MAFRGQGVDLGADADVREEKDRAAGTHRPAFDTNVSGQPPLFSVEGDLSGPVTFPRL